MALERNTQLVKVNDGLSGVDPGSLTALGNSNKETLSIFGSRITGVFDGTGDDSWSDNVKSQLAVAVNMFVGIVDHGVASSEFIAGGAGPVGNLKKICEEYIKEFDKYDQERSRTDINQYDEIIDENNQKKKIVTKEYLEWKKLINAYEQTLPQLESEALRVMKEVKNYFSAVDFTTNTIDSSVYKAGADEIKIQYSDMLLDIARIPDDAYVRTNEPEWEEDPDNPGRFQLKEEFKVDTDTPDGGHYTGEKEVQTVAQDIDGDGKIDANDAHIYQKVHEDGKYTAPDGKVYGYVGNSECDEIGIIHVDQTLTDEESGDDVYKLTQDRAAAYTDIIGADTTEYNTVVETQEETTESRTVTTTAGDNEYTERVEVTMKNDDPQCGSVKDGVDTITVYRDENGKLRQKTEYVDKNGKTREHSDVPVEEETKTFIMKYPDGHTETLEVNPNNPIDQQRMINKMEDARSQYYTSGASRSGLQLDSLLTGGEARISDVWTDDEYIFTLE